MTKYIRLDEIKWAKLPEIHRKVKKVLTQKEIEVLWGVGKDLAEGKITRATETQERSFVFGRSRFITTVFHMNWINAPCGSPLCIAGHCTYRLQKTLSAGWYGEKTADVELGRLFTSDNSSSPKLAAKAIYRFLTQHNGEWGW
jgi:hypothetical protein